jgi:hypothetical protein
MGNTLIVKTNELPLITDLTDAKIIGLDKDGVDARFPVSSLSGIYKGEAISTTNPGTPTLGQMYTAKAGITYTNFKDATDTAITIPTTVSSQPVAFALLQFNGTSWNALIVPITLSGYTLQTDFTPIQSLVNVLLSGVKTDISGTQLNGYIAKATGVYTAAAGWKSTDFVDIYPQYLVRKVGSSLDTSGGSAATTIAFYDSAKVFLGTIIGIIPADFTFYPKDYYPTARYVRATSSTTATLALYVTPVIKTDNIEDLNLMKSDVYNKALQTFDYASLATTGYYNTSGVVTAGTSWRHVDLIACKEGDKFYYTGITSSVALAVVGWNSDLSVMTVLVGNQSTQATDKLIIVPAGIAFIAASSRMTGSDVFAFKGTRINVPYSILNTEALPANFMPKKAWGKQGDLFRMNPFGIIAKHPLTASIDMVWNNQNSNERSLQYTIGAEASKDLTLSVRDSSGRMVSLGTTTLNITHTTQNPATPQVFMHWGDSTVDGIASANISGAIINEVSRRLTGTGTALMTGSESPTALSLANIKFIGTRGDQPIKHEGYPGSGAQDFNLYSTIGGLPNAFWNPTTLQFDFDYYLSHNNFNDTQITGGVNATGSNLTILLQLGWNHVYQNTIAEAKAYMRILFDKVKLSRSAVRFKLIGMPGPYFPLQKAYTGTRNVSPESVMREAIIAYSNAWQELSLEAAYSSFVEFVPTAPFFFPEKSYPTVAVAKSARNAETIDLYTDYVHPVQRGYAQMADVIYYNLLFNYCKLT